MSRRAHRRETISRGKSRGKGSKNIGKWVLRTLSILVVIVIFSGFGLYSWLQSYLHSDDFRVFMSETVGDVMGADAQFELFEWEGMRARTAGLSLENGGVIRELRADGVQASIGLAGVRRGVWEVSDVRVSQLHVKLDTTSEASPEELDSEDGADDPATDESTDKPGFLDRLLPDRTELTSVELASLNLDLKTSGGGLSILDTAARVEVESHSEAYNLRLSGGVIDTSWFGSPLELVSARGKYKDGRLFLTESRSKVYKRGWLTLNGEVDGGDYAFFGKLKDVRAEELLPEDWQKRLTGDLATKFKVSSSKTGTIMRGELELKKGVLTALPVLDTIAAYANSRRFRRLNLSEARLKFVRDAKRLELTNIVLACEGLVRVVGSLSVVDGQLDGRFRVGVMPGTLAHIPGAETKVFVRGDKGLLWTPLRITGTMDDPKEDLSQRMLIAAGERMFELVPETGKMALKFAQDSAVELPRAALDSGSEVLGDVLGEDGGVLQEGTDIIGEGVGGLLNLIPGSSKDE